MRVLYVILLLTIFGCNLDQKQKSIHGESIENNSVVGIDSLYLNELEENKLRVIVLPPYDLISNRGISPNIQKYLEKELSKSKEIDLIEFPYKKLINISYYNIYDKKYCKPIIDNVDCDIIVMTKIDLVTQTGNMQKDSWSLRIKLFNTQTEIQLSSKIIVDSLSSAEIEKKLSLTKEILINEIKSTVTNTLE
nr:hypothetical protein [uncultured Carboxylicivirga sp.]